MGPNIRDEDGCVGVGGGGWEGVKMCMYGSLCVLSRAKGPQQQRRGRWGVSWNYSYSLHAERKALDGLY